MRLHYLAKEGKRFISAYWFNFGVIFLVIGVYGLGLVTSIETFKIPIYVEKYQEPSVESKSTENKYILASKSGTKFYFTWCGGSNRIKEENRVFFGSVEEAISSGYELAKNCPGM